MVQNERNCLAQVVQAFFPSAALAIGARDFRAIGDVPFPVALDDGAELVPHLPSVTLGYLARAKLADQRAK